MLVVLSLINHFPLYLTAFNFLYYSCFTSLLPDPINVTGCLLTMTMQTLDIPLVPRLPLGQNHIQSPPVEWNCPVLLIRVNRR